MISMSETVALQQEYFRTREIAREEPLIPLHMLGNAFKHLGPRRTKAANNARQIIRAAMLRVLEDYDRAQTIRLHAIMTGTVISARNLRVPLSR